MTEPTQHPAEVHHAHREHEAALALSITGLPVGATVLYPQACDLLGWSLVAGAGGLTLTVADGVSAGAPFMAGVVIAASQSNTQNLPTGGVRVETALQVTLTAVADGCLFIRPRRRGQH